MPARWALGSQLTHANPPATDATYAFDAADKRGNPFLWLEDVPSAVDAAVVLNNPAEHFLLNDSGRFIRKLLTLGGVFTHTEQAWEALSQAFNADTDETIKSLLSKRVVVVWDGIGSSSESIFKLADAIDTQWALVCEVDPKYLQRIREHLRPVRRRIEQGHPVYAIEKGRYEIVLLNSQANHRVHQGAPEDWDGAAILLAPRKGSSLLNHMLRSYTAGPGLVSDQDDARAFRSILQGREELIASVEVGADWSIAWIVQPDRFTVSLKNRSPKKSSPKGTDKERIQPSAVVGIISTLGRGISLEFATDMDVELANDDAPIGLLSAVGGDAILAVATSRTPSFFVENDLFHTISTFKDSADQAQPNSIEYPVGPGFILLSKAPRSQGHPNSSSIKSTPIALAMLTQLDPIGQDDEPLAVSFDKVMQDLFLSYGQSDAPDYQGKFPRATRTYTIERSPQQSAVVDKEGKPSPRASWLGNAAKFSWLVSESDDTPFAIVSLAPDGFDAAKQIRWIAQAAQNLDSIPDQPKVTGVITSGFFRPGQAIELLDSVSGIDLGISRLIKSIEWNLIRIPIGIGGTVSIEFSENANFTKLGQDRAK